QHPGEQHQRHQAKGHQHPFFRQAHPASSNQAMRQFGRKRSGTPRTAIAPDSQVAWQAWCVPQQEAPMTHPRVHLVEWLRDAHAMEQHSEQMLRGQAKRLERYPKLAQALQRHLEQTLAQKELLEQCLQRMDASPSALKDLAGRLGAGAQALATMAVEDEPVKATMACL